MPSRRFPLLQKGKLRPIDDLSESYICEYTGEEYSPWAADSDVTQPYTTEQVVAAALHRGHTRIPGANDGLNMDGLSESESDTPLSECARTEMDEDECDEGYPMNMEYAEGVPMEGTKPAPHITLEVPYSSRAEELLQQWRSFSVCPPPGIVHVFTAGACEPGPNGLVATVGGLCTIGRRAPGTLGTSGAGCRMLW